MRKFYTICAMLALFFLGYANSSPVEAQEKSVENDSALFYEISGNEIEKPSYLFGTIHLICSKDMIQIKQLTDYIDKTERLFLEVDFDDPKELQDMGKIALMENDKTLNDLYTKEQYSKVDMFVQKTLGIPLETFKNYKPIFITAAIITSPKSMGCSSPDSYDLSLLKYAIANNKPIEGLETVETQKNAIDSYSLKEQSEGLYQLSLEPQKTLDGFKTLLEKYKTQSSDTIYEFMQTGIKDDTVFQTNILDERNIAWIPKIEKAVKEKPSFIAVGAGHLGGENGVVKLLKAKGYKLKPIRF